MGFNCKQFKYKAFQFLSIVEMLHPNTRLVKMRLITSSVDFLHTLSAFSCIHVSFTFPFDCAGQIFLSAALFMVCTTVIPWMVYQLSSSQKIIKLSALKNVQSENLRFYYFFTANLTQRFDVSPICSALKRFGPGLFRGSKASPLGTPRNPHSAPLTFILSPFSRIVLLLPHSAETKSSTKA